MSGWATPDDIRRATTPEEAAKALAWQSEQNEIAGQRIRALELFKGNPLAAKQLEERWAALLAGPGEGRSRRVVEH